MSCIKGFLGMKYRGSSFIAIVLLFLFLLSAVAAQAESICAEVKIEIKQELTLERQAFDAHMRINNGLDHISLENVNVDVTFADEDGNAVLATSDPNNLDAKFYIRIDTMEGITDVTGNGTVAAATSADIHWLIIPAPGASNGLESGTMYYVGAKLTYTVGGEEHITEVTPDYIFVKPMPMLTLDYFLPYDVYGDDPQTTEIEAIVPFHLGVRVNNTGYGTAKALKIESAQPTIKENDQGLHINFKIIGSEVNGQPATESLLADFGDIGPNSAGVGSWLMTTTLSGIFKDFEASFTHADELGGELTSLMEAVNTHRLVRYVKVDLPGRDQIGDFLALDSDVYRVYESNTVDTEVLDQSLDSSMTLLQNLGNEVHYSLDVPPTDGFLYVKLTDPNNGNMVLKEIVRADGKRIREENGWLHKTRVGDGPWQHFVNLFDANNVGSGGSYTVVFIDETVVPQPPVMQFIADKIVYEGSHVGFLVESSDPNNTIPSLSGAPLPAGATFTDKGDGTGIFSWFPASGQSGRYEITFTATDNEFDTTQRMAITVFGSDSDNDGLPDDWELEHFGDLSQDGDGDYDGDGISNRDELLNGTDPASNKVPSIPKIISPETNGEVTVLTPDLTIENSIDLNDDTVTYECEVYADDAMTELVASDASVIETVDTTTWNVPSNLTDNTMYWWRVRATDGIGFSEWEYGSFFVNTANDAPGDFAISYPQDSAEIDIFNPDFIVTNSIDADRDVVTYVFEIYADDGVTLLTSSPNVGEGTNGSTLWPVNITLSDNTWYVWKVIVTDEHGASTETSMAAFFVNTGNDAPEAPVVASPLVNSEVEALDAALTVTNSVDLDGDTLTYYFEIDTVNTFDSGGLISSGPVSEGVGETAWNMTGLNDNTWYFWRAMSTDGFAESPWVIGSFFVNTVNDLPSVPTLKNPGDGAWVTALSPMLEVHPSIDVDHDPLLYSFAVYSDAAMTQLVTETTTDAPEWTVDVVLDDNVWYYWRTQAKDVHGGESGWMVIASFFTDSNGINDTPEITLLTPDADLATNDTVAITWEDRDPDSSGMISLFYDTDAAGEDGVLIATEISEDDEGPADSFVWDITAVAEGTYYIYAMITDGNTSSSSYAIGAVTVDRTAPVLAADPAGGTYEPPQSVALSADEAAYIYYTTNDADQLGDFVLYTAPVAIPDDATLRFVALDEAGNQSVVYSESYIITDSDEDGLPDDWELAHFGDLTHDGTEDGDNDGLTDAEEYANNTVPVNADTDGDGLPDGWEVAYGLDPLTDDAGLDPDNDGFTSEQEYTVNARPNDPDSKPLPPVANAGIDQAINEQLAVNLDGTGSSDPDDAIDTYNWVQVGEPTVTITDPTASSITVITPDVGPGGAVLTFELTVTDALGLTATDEVSVQVIWVNEPPVANAGIDQTVDEGKYVALNGSESTDIDDGIKTYNWTQLDGPEVDFDDYGSAQPTFKAPDVMQDGAVLTFALTVADTQDVTSTDEVTVNVLWVNEPPVTSAGPDQTIDEQKRVDLIGSNSIDVDDNITTYKWTQLDGATVDINNPNAADTFFIAPDVGMEGAALVFELTVTDIEDASTTDSCIINVTWVNAPPVARAGEDQILDEGEEATLDGSESSDVDDGIEGYFWKQLESDEEQVALSDATAVQPFFDTPNVGPDGAALHFELTVTDMGGLQSTDAVNVNVTWVNMPPYTEAGDDQTVAEGSTVTLDGSNSWDEDDGIATYIWKQTSGPAVVLDDPAAVTPTFATPDVSPEGATLVFELTVADKGGLETTDTCEVHVTWSIHSFALFALDAITVENGSVIQGGDIGSAGVAEMGKKHPEPTVEIDKDVYADDSVTIFGDVVDIDKKASVCTVHANVIENKGEVRCTVHTPLEWAFDFEMPMMPDADSGTDEIELKNGEQLELGQGSYGEVELKSKSVLILTGGTYHFSELEVGNRAQLLFTGPAEVIISDEFETGEKVVVGPAPDSGLTAKDITFFVLGMDEEDDDHKKHKEEKKHAETVEIGHMNTWKANLYAPDCKLEIKQKTVAEGSFIAGEIEVGENVTLTRDSGF